MNTATDTIVCPKCGGEMLVGVMPTESELSVNVHGVCQACDYHLSNKMTVDAMFGKHRLLQNRDWVVRQFREGIEMHKRVHGGQ